MTDVPNDGDQQEADVPNDNNQIDERSKQIFETIGKSCEDHGIKRALFIAIDPETNDSIIYHRGDTLSAAKLAAHFVRVVKTNILRDLDV